MKHLTKRQQEIMSVIQAGISRNGYPPTLREIGEAVGLQSSSTVHGHLQRMEEKGYIKRDPTKPRAIEILQPSDEKKPSPESLQEENSRLRRALVYVYEKTKEPAMKSHLRNVLGIAGAGE